MSDKLNWDNFSEAAQNAIAIACQNYQSGTEEPTFPRCDVAFDVLGEVLVDITINAPELSHRFCDELHCITKVLLELSPSIKDSENLSDEQMQQKLLQKVVINFVVSQFHQIIAQCKTASQMAEMDSVGGENESIH